MGYRGKLSAFHLLNLRILFYRSHIGATFLGQKCTKKRTHLHSFNALITNKIIIIWFLHAFSLERFFSISHF